MSLTYPPTIYFPDKKNKLLLNQVSYAQPVNQPVKAAVKGLAKPQKSGYIHSPRKVVVRQEADRSQTFFRSTVKAKPLIRPAVSYLGDRLSQEKRKPRVTKTKPLYLPASNSNPNGQHKSGLSRVTAAPHIDETLFLAQFLMHAMTGNKPKRPVVNQKVQKAIKKVERLQDMLRGKAFNFTRSLV